MHALWMRWREFEASINGQRRSVEGKEKGDLIEEVVVVVAIR